jgi:hypothetical protein
MDTLGILTTERFPSAHCAHTGCVLLMVARYLPDRCFPDQRLRATSVSGERGKTGCLCSQHSFIV